MIGVYRRRVSDALLTSIATVVATSEQRDVRAQRAAELIREATRVRWVGIYTVTDDMVTNEAWSGPAAPAHPAFPVTDGLTSQAVRSRSIALSNDVARDPRYLTNQDDTGSELIVPILDAQDVLGTLDIESDAVGAFDGAAIAAYQDLARALRRLWC